MKRMFRRIQIGTILLGAGAFLSFAGALASTVAWYAYATNTQIEFNGTSVSKTEQLQVGLKTDIEFTDTLVETYGLTQVTNGDDNYVFAAPGLGLDSTIIEYYLSHTHYAQNKLQPVSSHAYELGDELSLYSSPKYMDNMIESVADKNFYSVIPLAFRVIKNNANIYAKGQNIWITDATCIAGSGVNNQVYKSVRTFFKGTTNVLLNPSELRSADDAHPEYRSTAVGGLLDLNDDGYYDYTGFSFIDSGTEYIYGEYEGTPSASFIEEDTEIDDVNKTGNEENLTTFTAMHRENTNIYNDITAIQPKVAKYYALEDIMPDIDTNGLMTNGIPVTQTSNDSAAIADLELVVYIEGWDHSVINNQDGFGFDLGLTFEINRVE